MREKPQNTDQNQEAQTMIYDEKEQIINTIKGQKGIGAFTASRFNKVLGEYGLMVTSNWFGKGIRIHTLHYGDGRVFDTPNLKEIAKRVRFLFV